MHCEGQLNAAPSLYVRIYRMLSIPQQEGTEIEGMHLH